MLHQGLPLTPILEDGCTGVTAGRGTLGTRNRNATENMPLIANASFPSSMYEGISVLHQPFQSDSQIIDTLYKFSLAAIIK